MRNYALMLLMLMATMAALTAQDTSVKTQPVKKDDAGPVVDSILLRVRRITYEDAYIVVPVTSKIIKESANGKGSIDTDAFVAEAIRLSKYPSVEWKVENVTTEAHPMQQPKPSDRHAFDGFSVLGK